MTPYLVVIKLNIMIHLPSSNYTWFPVRHSPQIPLYINLLKLKEIKKNSDFINLLKTNSNPDPVRRYRDSFQIKPESTNEVITSVELEENIQNIHFNPETRENCFNEKDQRQGFNRSESIWLPAERFFWDFPSLNLGSSRHMLIKSIQLKGSGNNPMAVRYDNAHSWGGSYLWSNLKGLGFNILYKGILSKGLQELISISIWPKDYQNKEISTYELNSVVCREAKSYRLAQLMSGIDPDHYYKSDYQKAISKHLPENYDEYLDGLYFQYGQMLSIGICDLNITKENVMIDGSLIDYEDISYFGNDIEQVFTLKLYYPDKVENKENLLEIIKKSSIYLSDYHIYLDALEMSQKTYNKYFEKKYDNDLSKDFFDFLVKFRREIYNYTDEHFRLLEILSSHSALYRNGTPYFNLREVINLDLCQFLNQIEPGQVKLGVADDGNTILNITLKFPRGKWINSGVESYYKKIKKESVKDLVIPLLKLSEIYFEDRKSFEFHEALKFSSKANEILSKNSWISPFTYKNKKFSLQSFNNLIDIEKEILDKTNFSSDLIDSYFGVMISDNPEYRKMSKDDLASLLTSDQIFILQGFIIKYSDFDDHFVPFNLYISNEEI